MWKRSLNISTAGRKVFVGLSGGVDSAVAALLLKKKGFDVTGVFIKAWQPFDKAQGKPIGPCTWRNERRDAMKVCIALGIPFLFFDFETEYKKEVVDKMLSEYKAGRTPNPDILCNKEIKFGLFWDKAREMGANYIATGHYARIENEALKEGIDKEKDQSYFLWTLRQVDLSHIFFPIGNLKKKEVRGLARRYKLSVSGKKDSQGICFIGDIKMDEFLSHFIFAKTGRVLNTAGEIIGTHNGAVLYTIGERHGFEILKKKPESGAYYIVSKDIKANTITVSDQELEISSLSPTKVIIKNVNWITEPVGPSIFARIRYRGEKIPVTLSFAGKRLAVEFGQPMRGLSLGQSIVFYDGDTCLGGGVMDKILE
ncbi:MAG: tRNA 2-thiouridine(34) synthase MnmA [Candidatus Zambryskibacteria bacterium]|nr:tRNA 2-thiouridine(34) synthase MnmA [Candidatus Zambryskibacteria bacterium]